MFYRHLLVVRFAIFNAAAFALLVAAYLQGWLDGMFAEHFRELVGLIFVVFLYGLVVCALRIWQYGNELNGVKAGAPVQGSRIQQYIETLTTSGLESRAMQADALRLRLTNKIVVVRHIANALVFLGLIGTVIGFIIALSGVDPEQAAKVENVAEMVATLINGMSIALYTTLAGAVLYVWLIVAYRMLVTGTVDLITSAIEFGEQRARA